MTWSAAEAGYGGYWTAEDQQAKGRIRARATAALAFLDRFAGPDSRWTQNAHRVFVNNCDNQSMETGTRSIGDVIAEWAKQVRSGQLKPRSIESLDARAVAATDLMEQVQTLNGDVKVSPAAPIVLAGAALEIALRTVVEDRSLDTADKPGIAGYAKALRTAGILNKQDMKDIEQMAGLRNSAAHGDHELLSRERAGLMEQQVNLFLTRLTDAAASSGWA